MLASTVKDREPGLLRRCKPFAKVLPYILDGGFMEVLYGFRKKKKGGGFNFIKGIQLGLSSVVQLAVKNDRVSEAHSKGPLCLPTAARHLQASRWFVHDHILIPALFRGK